MSDFLPIERDGETLYIKTLENGATIQQDGELYYVYDPNGEYLGWNSVLTKAEYVAKNGFVFDISHDQSDEILLETMWNDASSRLMRDSEGRQIICLPDDMVYLRAKQEGDGFILELVSDVAINDEYYDKDNECWELTVIDQSQKFKV